jgi:hypothetical protein
MTGAGKSRPQFVAGTNKIGHLRPGARIRLDTLWRVSELRGQANFLIEHYPWVVRSVNEDKQKINQANDVPRFDNVT